jgi:hypothetical protein
MAISVLVAILGAIVVGVVAARTSDARSLDSLAGVAGVVLAGIPALGVLLFVLFGLLGWAELR